MFTRRLTLQALLSVPMVGVGTAGAELCRRSKAPVLASDAEVSRLALKFNAAKAAYNETSRQLSKAERAFDDYRLSIPEGLIAASHYKPGATSERDFDGNLLPEYRNPRYVYTVQGLQEAIDGVIEHEARSAAHKRRKVPLKPSPFVPEARERLKLAVPYEAGLAEVIKSSGVKEAAATFEAAHRTLNSVVQDIARLKVATRSGLLLQIKATQAFRIDKDFAQQDWHALPGFQRLVTVSVIGSALSESLAELARIENW